jgi:hypothetical protein
MEHSAVLHSGRQSCPQSYLSTEVSVEVKGYEFPATHTDVSEEMTWCISPGRKNVFADVHSLSIHTILQLKDHSSFPHFMQTTDLNLMLTNY